MVDSMKTSFADPQSIVATPTVNLHARGLQNFLTEVVTQQFESRGHLTYCDYFGIQGVSQLLKQSDWAQIQDFK